MSNIIEGLLYTKEDEWVKVDGDTATVGVTDFAQDSLSDIVFLELPDADSEFASNDVFGVIESVKAAADLYMPLSGVIIEANEALLDTPELVNEDPYGEAWLVKIKLSDPSELEGLMDAAAYGAYCEDR